MILKEYNKFYLVLLPRRFLTQMSNQNYQSSQLYRLIRKNVASALLLDCFFIMGSIPINEKDQARR